MLLKILRQNDFQLDERYLDNPLKQAVTVVLLKQSKLQSKISRSLELKFSIASKLKTIKGLKNQFEAILVFNLINLKLETYAVDVVLANPSYLIPIVAEHTGVVQIELNNELYLLGMNDRKIIKLFKQGDALTSDMSPFVIKQYSDFFALSYKQLNLNCDEQGVCDYVEGSVQPSQQFVLTSY